MPESKPHSSPFHTQRLAMIYALVVMHHKRYDPWGVRKDPITWKTDFSAGGSITARGYTMHEHLDDFGLINMNGRIYDPLLGRFLSPDNNIQAPGNPQNYNRYSYALNNPLVYTDPDGEIIVPIMIGAGISVLTNGITNSIHDKPFFKGAGKAAVIGGLGGAFSFGIGQAAVGMSGFGKTAFQTLAHGHLGGM
ncbi:MAG: RHS repeat-associated core domain-containing protein, partial [Bacteroidales bacterium]|nr:RHS repeat-associated core domain-containing protein [Bacteroidales bacterium]